MPRAIALAVAAAVLSALPIAAGQGVVFVVRHAEAGTGHGEDPELIEVGQERAEALADMLEHAGITHLFSTEYLRTRNTLAPLAKRLGIEPTVVPGSELERQIEQIRELPAGSVAVVAGHSNTVPAIVRGLGGEIAGTSETVNGEMLPSDAYDRLFVVVSGSSTAVELRYTP